MIAGRCSHICNAGFLTTVAARGKGVGQQMGEAYLEFAPKLVCEAPSLYSHDQSRLATNAGFARDTNTPSSTWSSLITRLPSVSGRDLGSALLDGFLRRHVSLIVRSWLMR